MAKETTLYVRNGRPNRVVFYYGGSRYKLEHRGNRQDSTALPIEAKNDPEINRWLKIRQLEEISKESFMRLGARQVDVRPNEFLKRDMRINPRGELRMNPAEGDTTKSLTQVNDGDVHKTIRDKVSPKWAADLMTTEEELETFDYKGASENSYPSHHRDDDLRREIGY